MREKVLSALKWLAIAKFSGQIFSWVVTILVIRILTPADYGLLAMATLFTAFLFMVGEMGLGAAIIQGQHKSMDVLRKVFALVIVINLSMMTILMVAAPWIADFFNEPRLTLMIRVLSLEFLIFIFEMMPQAMLERDIEFKNKSLIDLLAVVIGSIVTLTLALLGYGVWSLIISQLTIACTKAIGLNIIRPFFQWPDFHLKGMKDLASFGGLVTLNQVMWYFFAQADAFIVAKLLGKQLLGYYSVAIHLATLPMQKINSILNQVAFPAFSQVQEDREQVAYYLVKASRVVSFFAFPVFWGLSSVSEPLILGLIGEQWAGSIVPLGLLTLIMPLRMIASLYPSMLKACGRPGILILNLTIGFVVMVVAFLIGSQWGLLGICLAWLIAYPLVFIIQSLIALPIAELAFSRLLRAIALPFGASLLMYGVVWLTGQFTSGAGLITSLISMIAMGGLTYVAVSLTLNKQGSKELIGLLRS